MPTGPIAPTSTLDGCGGRHILTRPEGRSYPTARGRVPPRCSPLGMWPLVRWGGGRRSQPRCRERNPVAVATALAEPAAALLAPLLGSLAPSLSPPSLPPLRCGLGEGLAEAGSEAATLGPGSGAARGEGLSPGTILCLALQTRSARRRGTHGPRHPP